ncbi:hypothetical protein RhiirA5_350719 [Rhizophagus irregularis]|nr:hypothetical protein RirG_050370 [Rhizophagus irregularis DAOM 197198w]PKC14139.1 hypothetical protein RhiirA5_350719 [Rhizophagus irregularis]PKC73142.1 hypothetical protein RhiirA1_410969 [Rhizophagus irregularis]PKK79221.1 hypothetical protein RhiirC2_727794 [Rhizophagus irregularis]PKY15229.1 hypothetical protein RhiirB3_401350 [Rhizophagus irregularis]
MHIIIFLISLLILCSINLTNCQYPGFPTSPPFLTSTTGFPEPSLTPLPSPTSLLQPTFSNNPFLTPEEPTFGSSDSPIQPSIVTVLSTTTTYVGPAVTTLPPTATVVTYVTVVDKTSSCNKPLLNLWNIGIFNIISTIALWFT